MNNSVILPGLKPTLEILRANPRQIIKICMRPERENTATRQITALCLENHIPLETISAKELGALCGNDSQIAHQGIAAVVSASNEVSLPEFLNSALEAPLPLIMALDQIKDPRNLGAIARSAYSLGAAGLLLPIHNSSGLTPAALKASAGALLRLPVCRVTNLARALDTADEQGFAIYGTDSHSPEPLNAFQMQWPAPLVIVMGSEESGLRPGVAKRCHAMLKIPFARRFESLNVAQAAGMLMALYAAGPRQQP